MRLASELFTILEAARFITRQQDCVYHTSSLASSPQTTAALQHLDEQRVALESSLAPHLASHAHLLWHSTQKLPDLLSGAVLSRAGRLGVMGMQVLSFHGSSTAEGLKLTGLPLLCHSGTVAARDVIFPDDSPDLVEAVYRASSLAETFSAQLATAVRTYVEARLQVSHSPQWVP